jgi:TolB-like protein/Flp pilus assembly protein TadD
VTVSIGARLGSYEVVAAIGAGGMGEVYRAHDTKLDRDVALKILPPGALSDETARARLVKEAQLAASLNHAAVCTIYDVGDSDGRVYVAMELIAGRRLSDVIPKGGLPLDEVLRYALDIADALAHAHDRGIVHRDLKGANVLVTPEGHAKVLDFGLAMRLPKTVEDATRSVETLDSRDSVAGTLVYMSPEALRGEMADVRTDIWSYGVLLYEMLSGQRPFDGSSGVDVTSAIVRDRPARLPASVPAGLAAIVDQCLQKDRGRRYANGGELRAAISAVRASADAAVRSSGRGWWWGVAAALAAAAVVAVVVSRGGLQRPFPAASVSGRVESLAVLPLEDLSGNPADGYLADGLTEELIDRLSRIKGLTVTSRTSVMAFKRSRKSVAEMARQLGVQAVVEGTIARSGDRMRVTARLVDAVTDRSLWSERYDRASADILTIQAEVAASVGEAIRINITPQERRRLSAPASTNSQAYDLYLRGRFHEGRESPEEIRQTIDYFERAVEADPGFAAAHAELARAYGQRLFYVSRDEPSLQERAFVEVQRALAIDADLDAAHLAQGLLLWQSWNQFPHERAIAEYRRTLALNPNSDEAHHQLGLVYLHIGLLDDAMREVHEAMRLNPANTLAHFREGVVFLYQARYADALNVFRQTPEGFQPPLVAFQSADALFHLGRKDDARATLDAYLRTHPEDTGGMNNAMLAVLAADRRDFSLMSSLISKAQEKGKGFGHFHHTAFTIARAYALAGQAPEAVGWLEQAAADGYPCYPVFAQDSALDPIRRDVALQRFLSVQRTRWEALKQLAP